MSTATVPIQFARPPRRPAASVAAVVVAGAIAVVSLGLFLAAGVLLWGESQKDAHGFVSTGSEPFATSTAAIVTQDLDVDLAGTGWALGPDRYGKVRLQVTPRNGKPVFVGIAPTREVQAYLRGTTHSTLTDIDFTPFRADYRRHAGARPRHAARGRVVLGGVRLGCRPPEHDLGRRGRLVVGRGDERRRLARTSTPACAPARSCRPSALRAGSRWAAAPSCSPAPWASWRSPCAARAADRSGRRRHGTRHLDPVPGGEREHRGHVRRAVGRQLAGRAQERLHLGAR